MARQVDEVERLSKRNEILDCAQRLVYSTGYEQMSIQDILSQMGISKGAFYHYFDSKPALLEALINRTSQQAEEFLLPIVENPDLPTLEKLESFFFSINRWKTSQRSYLIEILKVWYADENAIVRQKLMTSSTLMITDLLNRLIKQGIEEGVFHTDYPDMAGMVFFSLMTQMSDSVGTLLLDATTIMSVDPSITLQKMVDVVNAYTDAIERVLGTPSGSIHLIDRTMLAEWLPGISTSETITDQNLPRDLLLEKENLL
jgi:TetR/AcrR family transcriptional regulator, transcriptional repressor for nem operon